MRLIASKKAIASLGITTDVNRRVIELPGLVSVKIRPNGFVLVKIRGKVVSSDGRNETKITSLHPRLGGLIGHYLKDEFGPKEARWRGKCIEKAFLQLIDLNAPRAYRTGDLDLDDVLYGPSAIYTTYLSRTNRFAALYPLLRQVKQDCPGMDELFYNVALNDIVLHGKACKYYGQAMDSVDWFAVAPEDGMRMFRQRLLELGLTAKGWRNLYHFVQHNYKINPYHQVFIEGLTPMTIAFFNAMSATDSFPESLGHRLYDLDQNWTRISAPMQAALAWSLVNLKDMSARVCDEDFGSLTLVLDWLIPKSADKLWEDNPAHWGGADLPVNAIALPPRPDFANEWQTLIPPKNVTWRWFEKKAAAWHKAMAPVWEAEVQAMEASLTDPNALARHTWDSAMPEFLASQFQVVPLTNSIQLFDDGRVMHHCVSTYAQRCREGHSRIFSLRVGGTPMATAELVRHSKDIWTLAQCSGPCNQPVAPEVSLVANHLAARYTEAAAKGQS